MKSISASDMRSNALSAIAFLVLWGWVCAAEAVLIDRVIAVVDDRAITQSELEEKYRMLKQVNEHITHSEALQTMINRILLVNDARKYRMESDTEDGLLEQYIDLKIRALIRIQEKDIRSYYEQNRAYFSQKSYADVHEDILKYLTEQEVNRRLKKQLDSLRDKSKVSINSDYLEK